MRAILINPYNRTITEVEYSGNHTDIYKLIDCDLFDCVVFDDTNDGVFVDDEGLLKMTPETMFFHYQDWPQPLAGKALVVGTSRDGDSTDAKTSLDELKAKIKFLTLAEVRVGIEKGQFA